MASYRCFHAASAATSHLHRDTPDNVSGNLDLDPMRYKQYQYSIKQSLINGTIGQLAPLVGPKRQFKHPNRFNSTSNLTYCEEKRTSQDYFAATHGDWIRDWNDDWDGRSPPDDVTKDWMKGKLKLDKSQQSDKTLKSQSQSQQSNSSNNHNGIVIGNGGINGQGSSDGGTGGTGTANVNTASGKTTTTTDKPDHPFTKPAPKPTVRHIFLIRHGQYILDDNREPELTELGKFQSKKTGERLRAMADGLKKDHYGEIKIKWKRVIASGMIRAKQTADIIANELGCKVEDYDPLLNEGTPCLTNPSGISLEDQGKSEKLPKLLTDPPRIEAAYRKYVHRKQNWKKLKKQAEKNKKSKIDETFEGKDSDINKEADSDTKEEEKVNHEYEVIVCHMNVIRYFVVRALQLPPEAWLRFRGDNCGITEIIVYEDGRTSLGRFGDQGHLAIEETTFH